MTEIDYDALAKILPPGRVTRKKEDRVAYSYDASFDGGGRQYLPEVVVFPENTKEVSDIMRFSKKHHIPVVPRGAGSGLTGGALPIMGGMVITMNGLNRILEIDADNMAATVQPGVVTARFQKEVEKQGLFYPPDPASYLFSTIGGNIAENSGGMRAVKYGVTRDYILGLEVVLPSGDVIALGSKCIKDVVGYDLTTLFVGSEGTLGVITQATLKLLPLPEAHKTMTAEFTDLKPAAKTVPDIIKSRIIPSALEFLDHHCIHAVNQYLKLGMGPATRAFLLIEVDGPAGILDQTIDRINDICLANGAIATTIAQNEEERNRLWEIRRAISTALTRYRLRGDHQDVSVPRTRIPEAIDKMNEIAAAHGMFAVNFGHVGDGNLHLSLAEKAGPVDDSQVKTAMNRIMEAVVSMGGRVAAEHGIGLLKRDKMLLNTDKASLELMVSLKNLLDPEHLLNPGKIFLEKKGNSDIMPVK